MTSEEADSRTTNFFATTFLAIVATSAGHGLQVAAGIGAVAAELVLIAAAIAGVVWYLTGRNRFRRSAVPPALLAAGVVAKMIRMQAAYGMLVLGGADFAVAAFLAMGFAVVVWRMVALPRPKG